MCLFHWRYHALATARTLAAAIAPESPDLVLTGLQSVDAGYGQAGVILAELLDLPHATLIVEVRSSAWLMELNMMKSALLERVNEHVSSTPLDKIVFVLAETE